MTTASAAAPAVPQKKLFWACLIALMATSFAFIIRIMILGDLAQEFQLDETQKGEILGVGIWPFAVSIVLFSLIIDRIGYGKAILCAFIGHCAFAILTIKASGYWSLYIGSLCGGLAAGAVEAAINPIVATIFAKEKTKWLNILHAGWPAGMVAAGLMMIGLGDTGGWELKVGLIFIPVLLYGIMMLGCKFPVNERVAAGVSHREMMAEVGFLGSAVALALIFLEVGRVFAFPQAVTWGLIAVSSAAFGLHSRSLGRPLFFILVLIMVPLAITELGTDNWITSLMEPEMKAIGWHPLWVLVYTTCIMMILRFCAGPIVHRMSPLGLLATSSLLAILGLFSLSSSTGLMIFVAATLYGVGKTFFWPTMLGVVSEQFPKGGALTLNLISGVGMLAAGVLGSALLGNIQDRGTVEKLQAAHPEIHARVLGEERTSIFGTYRPVDDKKVELTTKDEKKVIEDIKVAGKKGALKTVTLFPAIMLVSYVLLMLWFRAKGGYRPVDL